jgi:hypothetical protein
MNFWYFFVVINTVFFSYYRHVAIARTRKKKDAHRNYNPLVPHMRLPIFHYIIVVLW